METHDQFDPLAGGPIIRARTSGQVRVHPHVHAELAEDASIRIERPGAILELNCAWTKQTPFTSLLSMSRGSKLLVRDNFKIFAGARIYINPGAELILGSGYINEQLNLSCFSRIEIGHDVALADGLTIRDSDNHQMVTTTPHQMTAPIRIGNHVWVGLNVTILKGVRIGDGAVIGAGSVVNRDIPPRCLAVGVPARVVRENVEWV